LSHHSSFLRWDCSVDFSENLGVPPPVDGTPPLSVLMDHGQSAMLWLPP
jgi:hypothetical protein